MRNANVAWHAMQMLNGAFHECCMTRNAKIAQHQYCAARNANVMWCAIRMICGGRCKSYTQNRTPLVDISLRFLLSMLRFILLFVRIMGTITSNGGYRHEEKSCKHWSLFTKLLSSVTTIFFTC